MDKLIALSEQFGVSVDSLVKNDQTAYREPSPFNGFRNRQFNMHYEYKSKRTLSISGMGSVLPKGSLQSATFPSVCFPSGRLRSAASASARLPLV
jgi:hypothetical protein